MGPDDVTAVIVTRGDCDLTRILGTLIFDKVCVWDNSKAVSDLGAYGRYQAIQDHVHTPLAYVQDDDCIVGQAEQLRLLDEWEPGVLSAMMPPERIDYHDTVLIGWGAIFDRDLPEMAFERWRQAGHPLDTPEFQIVGADFVFPMLTKWKRVDGYHTDLPHAHAPNRTWASFPNYANVKEWFLKEGRAIRDHRG
jgi:hypothetical protein